ncbi:unnamed protein product [Arabidopsis lyrata]|uniref:ABC transporter E family member 1 n=1 Tax=Arabidopsis lyrata subsp. lyrata TaxID=81972 RepID=UPI000A29B82B|nr:ABC transporter E family member 1 [Arabidopsis lyrata subsp. lyrata]XP_020888596.1 ABC transporter E family member 1 [Arabidopsis lyrata subsp. lyrata]CAH8260368.1 unnamed protein product [Arabidopsis lyrata]|eukprot:XP_020888595.1 ABC transporter E family member 1 [Arabidopsis lyrata subsp. lyrata]
MVLCNHCGSNVPMAFKCTVCKMKLENFNTSTEVRFVNDAAGQNQASGHIVKSVQGGISSSFERKTETGNIVRSAQGGLSSSSERSTKTGVEDQSKEIVMDKLSELRIDVPQSSNTSFIKHCIKCGLRVEKCPCESVQDFYVVPTHKYGHESFRLLRLPVTRMGKVLGIVGANSIGKTTSVKILAGELKPNLGNVKNPPEWEEIIPHFHDSELESYFTRRQKKTLKVLVKPALKETKVADWKCKNFWANWVLYEVQDRGREVLDKICNDLELHNLERCVEELSADELQRFRIALVAVRKADVYIFDNPSTFLDVRQRHKAAQVIRSLLRPDCYVIVVENDLSVVDFVADEICLLYGKPGKYGVATLPFSVKEGINVFLSGYLPREQFRFRDDSLSFEVSNNITPQDEYMKVYGRYQYSDISRTGGLNLNIVGGEFDNSQIVVVVGPRYTGKSLFLEFLERMHPRVSYKREHIGYAGCELATVRRHLNCLIPGTIRDCRFRVDVMEPLGIVQLFEQSVSTLSASALQKLAITICLGMHADYYLIDEPGRHLDIEQKICVSKVIKRYTRYIQKPAVVVEHDLMMLYYLADRVVLFEGKPHVTGIGHAPQSLVSGMNQLLQELNITVRRDPANMVPRINKVGSLEDEEQKSAGKYFSED